MNKILLVDDDELMSRMYQRVFIIEGYTIEVASDGLTGYNKAKIFKPDLILLDVMMPVMNGLQALEKLKTDPETKDIPVMMLTNLANEPDADYSLKKGAIKYLVKSNYDPKGILTEIRAYLNNDQSAALPAQNTYVCLGSCQAVITAEQYKNGLTKCGAESCTMKGQPFVKGKKSDVTGKNEAALPQEA